MVQVSGRQQVTFVGHNAARFDWPLLVRETQRMEVRRASKLALEPCKGSFAAFHPCVHAVIENPG
jgi:hypothetical protein